ncbi:Mfs monocarboxylate transporter [Lasiodiplodia theobromae]|uniref:Mfs monocarboxylate transporter n=1 Tax=Lasiodiplodia theobromae TaxID=45133 RepID=UPI0015C3EED6|nr:Mfs monocarboxylate transporter [Lasiodiplodia theobromae]KAF4541319.1 Mfs monocarboxylate transporter [Lasiodiplodia theobromae]
MKFSTTIFPLLAISGFSLAKKPKRPCHNAAAPHQGIGNYCRCADNTCWHRGNDDCINLGSQIVECPVPVTARTYAA